MCFLIEIHIKKYFPTNIYPSLIKDSAFFKLEQSKSAPIC